MEKEILLQSIAINSFKGIDKSKAVFLDLGKAYSKGKNIATFKGDQGEGKTSSMEAIMYLLGINVGKNPAWSKKEIINEKDGTISLHAELTIDGIPHEIHVTKDKFEFLMYVEAIDKFNGLDEPKETLRKLLGPLGTSPMFLKSKNGDSQIEWFGQMFSTDPELDTKRKAKQAQLKKLTTTRRDTNRDYERMKKALEGNDLYQDRENQAKRFEKPVTIEEVQGRLNKAKKEMEDYDKAVNKVENIKLQIKSSTDRIAELQKLIEIEEQKIEQLSVSKVEGERFIAERATAKMEYDEIHKEFTEMSQTLADQTNWNKVLADIVIMEEFESAVIELDKQKDKVEADLQKLTKKYLPDIDGLTMSLKEDEEGIYYHGKSIAKLSESELWGLYLQICKEQGIRFIFIENAQDLGSMAVDILNKMAADGLKIFASLMDRKIKTLKYAMVDTL